MSHLQRRPGGNYIEMNGKKKNSKNNSEKREKEMPTSNNNEIKQTWRTLGCLPRRKCN